ncbi:MULTISPECIES: helix-turn-helix domain-containing protein [Aerococcus]|uniref:helix-turn-helix domain-containing protein n=1 Tax=Aerococcus urinae (strain CCUG 59500 / ACS-120-V-Col10a) TaxID=2976812 RepID=UPI000200E718|nr:helix-turn-helix transcriptional regulator [Aerococcus sp. Group 1]AEA00816.1 DNA-binding helix-turn-helix protein [Aerococcus sp. Group 1]MCY3030617.1 helix-turn-helix domain-containing protein [Aerococcus sp. Group 1]MCY3054711.1 helix-turn-helix domain-containing protein [Aerococcus sp. Group 1]MCY3056441.1 helix-turn-helix domain-containing protein [Aerococcus sp. Group 1]MCY3061300.1 helix-turn-helix domain-containing protein [Aerococcus sp. Group 1]
MNLITGERIKELREIHGWTKQKLSDLLEMKSYTSITKWEQGNNLPRGGEIIKLCKLFDVSSDYLLGLKDTKK